MSILNEIMRVKHLVDGPSVNVMIMARSFQGKLSCEVGLIDLFICILCFFFVLRDYTTMSRLKKIPTLVDAKYGSGPSKTSFTRQVAFNSK